MSGNLGSPRHTKGAPKGGIHVRPRMLEARAMRAAGKPVGEIAAHFDVSKKAVHTWLLRLEEAEADARNRAAT